MLKNEGINIEKSIWKMNDRITKLEINQKWLYIYITAINAITWTLIIKGGI